MKKTFIFITIFSFQCLFAQKEVVGKVNIYNSYSYQYYRIDEANAKHLAILNSRPQKIEITQGNNIQKIETDSTGVFSFNVTSDSINFSVNTQSKTLKGEFKFDSSELSDTIKLNISDIKLITQMDSIIEPQFFEKFNIEQANLDFKNGTYQILIQSVCWPSGDFTNKIRKLSEKYKFKIVTVSELSLFQFRIMYRYNEAMRKLIGISEEIY